MTSSNPASQTASFAALNLAQPIADTLARLGYERPTPIQARAIPHVLAGKDLLGVAQTGTGKTAAFALPILDRLSRNTTPLKPKTARVLVLAPTRELVGQIAESFETYGQALRLSVAAVYGGVKIGAQIRKLSRGVDVLAAAPGRLLDLVDQGALKLNGVEVLVLDEADQMLDLGFIHALRRIAQLVPDERQTLFFSATMPRQIADLAETYLYRPERVSVAPPATTAERVAQKLIPVSAKQKPALLAHVLKQPELRRAIVFTRTKHGADKVVRNLAKADIDSVAIHGNKSQNQRQRALDQFKSGRVWVLVATDVAARGIDIDGITHVINYEIPNVADQYVHRIGRTARAGATGVAVAFVAPDERGYWRDIERLIKVKPEVLPLPDDLETAAPADTAGEPERERSRTIAATEPAAKRRPRQPRTDDARAPAARSAKAKPARHRAPRAEVGADRPAPSRRDGPPAEPRSGGERQARARSGERPPRAEGANGAAKPARSRKPKSQRPASAGGWEGPRRPKSSGGAKRPPHSGGAGRSSGRS